MTNRTDDWIEQAKYDLDHAKESQKLEHFEWACLSAQQAAEKAVKAVFYALQADIWGHGIARLLEQLPETIRVNTNLIEESKVLDKYYIPARYPNGLISGTPRDNFTKIDSQEAIRIAEKIIKFCQDSISTIRKRS